MDISTRWNLQRPRNLMTSTFFVSFPRLVFSNEWSSSHFTHPTIKPSNILVDAVSLSLVNGSTIDYATELIGSTFRIEDNPQSKGNGCGCGVSWELKA